MKGSLRILIILALAFSAFASEAGASSPQAAKRYMLKISMSEFKAHYTAIRAGGYDIAGMNIPQGKVDLIVSLEQVEQLRQLGIQVSRNPALIRNDAPDAKYKTPDQVAQALGQLQSKYPELAQVSSIGKSLQGRDILTIRITSHVDQPDGTKPTILFNGMHHAREVMSTEIPLDTAEYLLSNYGKDAKVTHWVDSNVIYVVPMLNVDGNNIVWTQDNMWRKNARGTNGVDINRNYPYQWNTCNGSSSDETADDYRGPAAASEPETNVLMNFVKAIHPVFNISYHSYSEIVIYPYGCGTHAETADVIEPLGKQMAALIPADSGTGTYTAGLAPELLYPVDGDDIDWMYHEAHVIPFVIEVNSDAQGFQPGYDDWRDKTVSKVRPAWELLLDRLDHASIHGQVSPRVDAAGSKLSVHVEGLSAHFVQNYPVHADGSFHAILNPGNYRVSVGGVTRTVHVNDSRLNLNF